MSLKTIIYLLWPVLFFFSYSCTAQDKLYGEFYDQALPQILNKESTDSVMILNRSYFPYLHIKLDSASRKVLEKNMPTSSYRQIFKRSRKLSSSNDRDTLNGSYIKNYQLISDKEFDTLLSYFRDKYDVDYILYFYDISKPIFDNNKEYAIIINEMWWGNYRRQSTTCIFKKVNNKWMVLDKYNIWLN